MAKAANGQKTWETNTKLKKGTINMTVETRCWPLSIMLFVVFSRF